jgi:SulP family sulfate permease
LFRSGTSTSIVYKKATLSANRTEILFEDRVMKKSTHQAMRLIETVIPGLGVARSYERRWLWVDLFAGLTIFAMLVPQGMAYGELAGVAPVVGLYTAIGALVGYALFGSSRRLMLGPESSSALLVAAAVAPVAAGGSPARFALLTALLALLVGVIALGAGLARLGFLADFVSKPILLGYITGVAIIMIAGQLGKLFGIKIESEHFFQMLGELITHLGQTRVLTLMVGLALLVFLLVLRRFAPKVPAALIVVVLMTIVSSLLHLDTYGIAVVGPIPSGLPQFGLPDLRFSDVWNLLPSALTMTLIVFTDAVLTARSVAEKHGGKVDANRELIGLGAANLASGLLQGFPAAASQSRTAVNNAAGGKTQLVGIVAATFLVVFLLWFTRLLENLPQLVLAVIIIAAAMNLIEVKPLLKVYRLRRVEFYLALVTFVGVLSIGVLAGILVAVVLALVVVIGRISRPHDAVLGSVEGVDGYQDIELYANSETVPGLIAYRFDAPLFFANADHFLTEVQELIDTAEPPVEWLLIDAEAIVDIDVTATEAISTLQNELKRKGIVLAIARANHPLQKMLKRAGLTERIGSEHFYPTVRTGVQAFLEQQAK